MSRTTPDKLLAALVECRLHAEVLNSAMANLPTRFTESDAVLVDSERRRWLDRAAHRFILSPAVEPGPHRFSSTLARG